MIAQLSQHIGIKKFHFVPDHFKMHINDPFPETLLGSYEPYFDSDEQLLILVKIKKEDHNKDTSLTLSAKNKNKLNKLTAGSLTDRKKMGYIKFLNITDPITFESHIEYRANHGTCFVVDLTKPIFNKESKKEINEYIKELEAEIDGGINDN